MATEGVWETLRNSWAWEFLCFTAEAFYQLFQELIIDSPGKLYFQMGHHHRRKRIRRAEPVSWTTTLDARPDSSSPLARHMYTSEDLPYLSGFEIDKAKGTENENKDPQTITNVDADTENKQGSATEKRQHNPFAKVIIRFVRTVRAKLIHEEEYMHDHDALLEATEGMPASEDGSSGVAVVDENASDPSSPSLSPSAQRRNTRPVGLQLMQAQIRAREGSSRRRKDEGKTEEEIEASYQRWLRHKQADMERKERKAKAVKDWKKRHEGRNRPHKELRTLGKRRRSMGDVRESIERPST